MDYESGFPKTDEDLARFLEIPIGTLRRKKSELIKGETLREGEHYKLEKNPKPKSSKDFDIFLWELPGAIEVAKKNPRQKEMSFLASQGIDVSKGIRIEHTYIDIIITALNGIAKCKRQYKVKLSSFKGSFKIDLYLPDYKIAIECDEMHHKSGTNRDIDLIRQQEIEKILGCQFIRFNPEERDFNFGKVLNQILMKITTNLISAG
jgi:very-short-patch-repair endonuclease